MWTQMSVQETLDSRVNSGDWVITPEDLPPAAPTGLESFCSFRVARRRVHQKETTEGV